MEMSQKTMDGVLVLSISGQVDLYNMSDLKDFFRSEIEKGMRHFILNLENLNYIDSSGISVLITLYTNLKNNGGALAFVRVMDSIYKIFEMTKLTNFFRIFKSEEEALVFLKS